MVGFAMASYAIANTIVVQIMPHVAKYVRRQILLAIATVINLGEMILWLFWNPTSDQLYLVFISVIAWGITDSIWKLETFGKIIYENEKKPKTKIPHCRNSFKLIDKLYMYKEKQI
jgi:hypothetical protein